MSKNVLLALILATLLFGGGWIWFSRVPESAPQAEPKAIPVVGHPAPDFTLQTLEGERLNLSDLQGEAVVLNFWASWCPPCRAEMPELEQAYRNNQGGGLVVLGVNQGEEQAVVADFARRFGLSFPILLDQQLQASRAYQANSLPTTYFIDRNGVIRGRVTGQMNAALLTERLRSIYP